MSAASASTSVSAAVIYTTIYKLIQMHYAVSDIVLQQEAQV